MWSLDHVTIEGVVIGSCCRYGEVYSVCWLSHDMNVLPSPLSQGIILVYDITSQKSFDNITKWLQNIEMVSLWWLARCRCVWLVTCHSLYALVTSLPHSLPPSPACFFRCGATANRQQVWLGGKEGCGEWERGAAGSEPRHSLLGNLCQNWPQHWWGQRSFDDVTDVILFLGVFEWVFYFHTVGFWAASKTKTKSVEGKLTLCISTAY